MVRRAGEGLRAGALDNHLKARAALKKVKVSRGESRGRRFDFKEWIDRDAYDIVQPNSNVTGITEALHIAGMARLRGKPCCPHNWHGGLTTVDNAAVVAAIPTCLVLELNQTFNPSQGGTVSGPAGRYLDLPNRPGLGMELKPGIAAKFPYIPGNYWKPNPALPA